MDEVELRGEAIEVVVLPDAGARLHRLRAFGVDVLRTPPDPATHLDDPFFWGSYVMAPWCNRIEAEPVEIGAKRIALGSNFPDGSAIHGQVHLVPWRREADGVFVVRGGGDGWPWPYEVRQGIEIDAATLRLRLELVNLADEPMPAGLGIHPWFRRPLELAIRAEAVHTSNVASEPWPVPVTGVHDLRRLAPMPDDLDATWTGLVDPPVELAWREAGIAATMRTTPFSPYAVAASPGFLDAIAVEPQTHAPQGLRRMLRGEPGGLAWLDAGATMSLTVELAFERRDGGPSARG